MEYRTCPSCESSYFFSALSGDKIVFQVSDNSELIMLPNQTFDEVRLYINQWEIYCDACAWSGPIDDLTLVEA